MNFCIKLAECTIRIHSCHDKVYHYCQEYLVEAATNPDIEIYLTPEDAEREREIIKNNNIRERRVQDTSKYSDGMLEVYALQRKVADALLKFDCFVMHGSAVAIANPENKIDECVIFTADSGVGKTTHTNLWLEQVPGAYILNGDKPLVRVFGNKVIVYGSPWQGKEHFGCNKQAVLRAICFMERDDNNVVFVSDLSSCLLDMLRQTHRPVNPTLMEKTLDLIGSLNCSFYRMKCNNFKNDTVITSYSAVC